MVALATTMLATAAFAEERTITLTCSNVFRCIFGFRFPFFVVTIRNFLLINILFVFCDKKEFPKKR